MKILHITASYKPAYIYGGPVMSVAKLCEELLRVESFESAVSSQQSADGGLSAIAITVYTTLANGKEELPYKNGEIKMVDGVEVCYFKRITKDHSHLSPALLWHLWKTVKQFDIVHIHAWWNLVTMPSCLIALLRGKKVILTPRGTLSSYSFINNNSKIKSLFHQLIGKKILNRCVFHVTSKKEENDTLKLLKPKGIFNIPNFVALPWEKSLLIKKQNTEESPLRLIFLSRIEQKKGLELLFDTLATVQFNWQLNIVGNGEAEYLESLKWKVESLKLREHINWLGAVYGDDKFALMAANDYLVLPSYDENFANVVIESIFTGTPVLITKNVGLSDYVSENKLGLVCERTLASLIAQLITANSLKSLNNFSPLTLRASIQNDFKESKLNESYQKMYFSI